MRRKLRGSLRAVALVVAVLMVVGCASTGAGSGGHKEKLDRLKSNMVKVKKAIVWIAPIACKVATAMYPVAAPACSALDVVIKLLQARADAAETAHNSNPTFENEQALFDVAGRLQRLWEALDTAYKGDPSKLHGLDLGARIHPFNWDRGILRPVHVLCG